MKRENLGLLLGLLGVISFGGTLPMTKIAVRELDPFFVTFARASIATFIALSVIVVMKLKPPPREEWKDYFIASPLITILFPLFVALGMREVPSSHGGVILGIIPLATAALSALILKERLSLKFWGFSVLGSLLVVAFALRQSGDFTFHKGDFILVAGVFSASAAYVYSGKLSKTRKGWEVVTWGLLPFFPVNLIGFAWLMPFDILTISMPTLLSIAYIALISQYLGFFPWNAGLAMGGVARVGQLMLFMPFVNLVFAYFFLGETLTLEMLFFLITIIIVVSLAARFK